MNQKTRRDFINACHELIELYSEDRDTLLCPFCTIAEELYEKMDYNEWEDIDHNYCNLCPWLLFSHRGCMSGKSFGSTPHKNRIPRLKRYIRLFEEGKG